MVLQLCYIGVTMVLQWCYDIVTMVLQYGPGQERVQAVAPLRLMVILSHTCKNMLLYYDN
jgi:hypothetical protein